MDMTVYPDRGSSPRNEIGKIACKRSAAHLAKKYWVQTLNMWSMMRQDYRATIERVGSPEWLITLMPVTGVSQAELVADLGQQLEAVGALDSE